MPSGRSVTIPEGAQWVAMAGRLIKHGVCTLKELKTLDIEDFFNGLMICDWQDYCEYIANLREG